MTSTVILSDNGVSSGSAGLKSQGGNDGVLILQTTTSGGTATNAVTISNTQNIGFGVTPSTFTGLDAGRLEIGSVGNSLFSNGSTNFWLTSNTNYVSGYKYASTGVASMYLQTSGQHQWHTAASGTSGNSISFTQSLAVGKGTTLALEGATSVTGTGVSFPATQSASTDANTLDDYEEGTFTPTFAGGGGNPSVSYAVQAGIYTKVGNLVTVSIRLNTNSVTGGSGNLTIAGLPFTSKSLPSSMLYNAANGFIYNWNVNPVACFLNANDISLALYSSTATNTVSTVANMSNTLYISITLSYQVA